MQLKVALKTKNELENLQELLETALEKLKSKDNEAVLLFRGVVHECDKILRIKYSEDECENEATTLDANGNVANTEEAGGGEGSDTESSAPRVKRVKSTTNSDILNDNELITKDSKLPPHFYECYSTALLYLAELDTTEPLEYLKMALELQNSDDRSSLELKSRILIKLIQLDSSYLEGFKLNIQELKKHGTDCFLQQLKECSLVLDDLETSLDINFIEYVISQYRELQSDLDNDEIKIQLGFWIQLLVDELNDQGQTSKCIELVSMAIDVYLSVDQVESNVNGLLLLGECHVLLGNLLDSNDNCYDTIEISTLETLNNDFNEASGKDFGESIENESKECNDESQKESSEKSIENYKKAVNYFERVLEIDSSKLSAEFQQFIDAWKEDMND